VVENARDWTEQEWLERLRAGDEAAFERLVRREGPKLLAVTRRILRSEDDAEDAVQEAFLSACRGLERFQGDSKLSTWLHRIAVNAALMRLRARRCRPEESIDALLPSFDADGHHAEPMSERLFDPAQELDRQRTAARVRACIDRLPESHRLVILLRDIEELDTQQTADVLGIGPDAVKMRLHRARQALRTLLAREAAAPEPGATDGAAGDRSGVAPRPRRASVPRGLATRTALSAA
jgi:RNA polymerase sigma-70 factor (ECF subfamily)